MSHWLPRMVVNSPSLEMDQGKGRWGTEWHGLEHGLVVRWLDLMILVAFLTLMIL